MNIKDSPVDCPAVSHEFVVLADGVPELNDATLDRLFEAGCDDATPGLRRGLLCLDFSREAATLQEAILSAILDVHRAGVGARVLRVDDCDLVTQADIARRVDRTRQHVHQLIAGTRGPGGFPPPAFHLGQRDKPFWYWCEVAFWLAEHHFLPPERAVEAEVLAAVNDHLEDRRRRERHPGVVDAVRRELDALGSTACCPS